MTVLLWGALAALWLGFVLPTVWRRLHAPQDSWAPWRIVLGEEMEEHYGYIENVFMGNAELIESMLGEVGPGEPTRESLGWGLDALSEFAATACERLADWRRLSHVVAAEVPGLPAVPRASSFRLKDLRRLSFVQGLRAWVTGRPFELRLTTLGRGFDIVRRAGLALREGLTTRAWPALRVRARELAVDFGTLSRESLASARALLEALERAAR